jgi:hypothetical protein
MVRPIIAVEKNSTYAVEAVYLMPHGYIKRETFFSQEDEPGARRTNCIPFSPACVSFQPEVIRIIVKLMLDSANMDRKLAWSITF